jgi:hypothetical protein
LSSFAAGGGPAFALIIAHYFPMDKQHIVNEIQRTAINGKALGKARPSSI